MRSTIDRKLGYDSRMARGLDEKQAAVDTGILNITVTLGSKFLAKVCRVLILDVLHNRIPTRCIVSLTRTHHYPKEIIGEVPSVVVNLVTVARSVDNVQPETDTVFLDN